MLYMAFCTRVLRTTSFVLFNLILFSTTGMLCSTVIIHPGIRGGFKGRWCATLCSDTVLGLDFCAPPPVINQAPMRPTPAAYEAAQLDDHLIRPTSAAYETAQLDDHLTDHDFDRDRYVNNRERSPPTSLPRVVSHFLLPTRRLYGLSPVLPAQGNGSPGDNHGSLRDGGDVVRAAGSLQWPQLRSLVIN